MSQPAGIENRRHRRSEVVATVTAFSSDKLFGTFLVQDLSAGGACLLGDVAVPLGTRVNMFLQFAGRPVLSLTATVVRHAQEGSAHHQTAVSFADLRPDQEDAIHEAIVAALERENARRAATVLVIAPDDESRDVLESDLRALGHEAVGVTTPLEALAWLERPGARISTVVIDVSPGAAQGLDVLEFLGEHHPRIHRVVMADELRPFRLDLALRSGRAHRVLHKPWDRHDLADAVARGTAAARDAAMRDAD